MVVDAGKILGTNNFKSYLSPKKRQGLLNAVREQSYATLNATGGRNPMN